MRHRRHPPLMTQALIDRERDPEVLASEARWAVPSAPENAHEGVERLLQGRSSQLSRMRRRLAPVPDGPTDTVGAASPITLFVIVAGGVLGLVDSLVDLVAVADLLFGGIAGLLEALVDLLVVVVGQLLRSSMSGIGSPFEVGTAAVVGPGWRASTRGPARNPVDEREITGSV
jgi:hypothetical protein